MTTIKSYTDLEQSKKLAEILPLKTADMHSEAIDDEGNMIFIVVDGLGDKAKSNYGSPVWSLAALLDILPKGIIVNKDSQNGKYHFSSKHIGTYITSDNPVDACYEMIIKLHELKESEEDEKIKKCISDVVREYDREHNWSHIFGVTKDDCLAWLKKQGEQKPADNVKPEFHEGDWLCENEPNNYARFIQILETVNVQGKKRYKISRDIHSDEDIVNSYFVENYYHKFNIKDAKDGDVLADDIGIILFRKIGNTEYVDVVDYYCVVLHRSKKLEIQTGIKYWGKTEDTKLRPATNEQCDTLMKAMADAGYEFDFEKKELKKL